MNSKRWHSSWKAFHRGVLSDRSLSEVSISRDNFVHSFCVRLCAARNLFRFSYGKKLYRLIFCNASPFSSIKTRNDETFARRNWRKKRKRRWKFRLETNAFTWQRSISCSNELIVVRWLRMLGIGTKSFDLLVKSTLIQVEMLPKLDERLKDENVERNGFVSRWKKKEEKKELTNFVDIQDFISTCFSNTNHPSTYTRTTHTLHTHTHHTPHTQTTHNTCTHTHSPHSNTVVIFLTEEKRCRRDQADHQQWHEWRRVHCHDNEQERRQTPQHRHQDDEPS